MDRAYKSGASATPPSAPASPSIGYPTEGNPAIPTEATKPGPWWYHMITEELLSVILAAAITPAQGTLTQLKQALDALYMPLTGGAAGAVQGSFKKLALSANGSSANISVSADEIVLENSSNAYVTARAVSLTINAAAAGANGLDTGSLAASTWYSVWVIRKPDGTTAGLISLSATTPTLPSGYTFSARVGWIRTDASGNKYPLGFTQKGRCVTWLIGSGNVTTPPQMASGVAGTFNTSTFTGVAVAWANYAPPTAGKIRVGMSANNTAIVVGVASNASRTGFATANPPELGFDSNAYPLITYGEIMLETANIYWASSGGTGYLLSGGWEDNL